MILPTNQREKRQNGKGERVFKRKMIAKQIDKQE